MIFLFEMGDLQVIQDNMPGAAPARKKLYIRHAPACRNDC